MLKISVTLLFCVFYANVVTSTIIYCPKEAEGFFIRSKLTEGLAIDGTSGSAVEAQHYTGKTAQIWKFERGGKPGRYYIINTDFWVWGKVLDVDANGYVILNPRRDTLSQQWILNANGRITNAATLLNLEVEYGGNLPGNRVKTNIENSNPVQAFSIIKA